MIPAMSRDACLEAFRKMLLIRRFEEACIVAAGEGKVPGHFHVYHGQEATGCAPDLNFPLSSGIVGGILPISTGTAYAMKHRKLPNVSVVFFGEGAVVRKGRDVTLVGYSIDLVRCLKAAAEFGTGRDRRRGDRPSHARTARYRYGLRIGRQDRSPRRCR